MTRTTPSLFALAAAASLLAGCVAPIGIAPVAPVAPAAPIQPVTPVPAVIAPTPVSGVAGLQSREPDACHAGTYRSAVGQPGTVIPGLGITRQYRVVEYRGIEPQEYDPLRIVFRLDAAGNIQNVDCG